MSPGAPPLRTSTDTPQFSAAFRSRWTFFRDVTWCVRMSALKAVARFIALVVLMRIGLSGLNFWGGGPLMRCQLAAR